MNDLASAMTWKFRQLEDIFDLFKPCNYRKAPETLWSLATVIMDEAVTPYSHTVVDGDDFYFESLGWNGWRGDSNPVTNTLSYSLCPTVFVTCLRYDLDDLTEYVFDFSDSPLADCLTIKLGLHKRDPSKCFCRVFKNHTEVSVRTAMPLLTAIELFIDGIEEGWRSRGRRKHIHCDE